MPERFLTPYVKMLPRLLAEAQMRVMDALLYAGNRGLKDSDARAVAKRLEEEASGGRVQRSAVPMSFEVARSLGFEIKDGNGGEVNSE